jgi:hypothetical protein
MRIRLDRPTVSRVAAAAATTIAGVSLFAATAYGGPYQNFTVAVQPPAANDNAGTCQKAGSIGATAVALASYTFVCADGQWLLTSLDSAGSDQPDGTITHDTEGNTFVSTDGVWVPQGLLRTPPIRVTTN